MATSGVVSIGESIRKLGVDRPDGQTSSLFLLAGHVRKMRARINLIIRYKRQYIHQHTGHLRREVIAGSYHPINKTYWTGQFIRRRLGKTLGIAQRR